METTVGSKFVYKHATELAQQSKGEQEKENNFLPRQDIKDKPSQ